MAVHPTCVLLLLHEWLEHASQSLSGGGGGGQGCDSALTLLHTEGAFKSLSVAPFVSLLSEAFVSTHSYIRGGGPRHRQR